MKTAVLVIVAFVTGFGAAGLVSLRRPARFAASPGASVVVSPGATEPSPAERTAGVAFFSWQSAASLVAAFFAWMLMGCGRDKPIWAVICEGHPFPTADSSYRERSACEAHVDDAINRALAHHAFPDAKAIASGCSCVAIPAPGRNQN
jgi:hypothetical protein